MTPNEIADAFSTDKLIWLKIDLVQTAITLYGRSDPYVTELATQVADATSAQELRDLESEMICAFMLRVSDRDTWVCMLQDMDGPTL